ncbi:MAG: LPS export ABC transporter permease LptF [Deltaproteobacteria bacterium]|nr:LPS export ABC transporter permease LptF [Deltaproteobacteria bacterium]
MKFNSIINRYILREMIPPFFITLVFFTFIFLMSSLLEITNLVVNYRIKLSSVFLLLAYSMPFFLEFIIPMSVMMAILLTFLRMSSDNEIVALKAGGLTIYSLLPPVFLYCIIGCILTGFMAIYGLPWGKLSFKKTLRELVVSNVDIGLKERAFNDSFKGVMLYVNKIDAKNKMLIDVFIEDQRTSNIVSTVIAPKGRLSSEPNKLSGQLTLYNGTINNVDFKDRTVHSISFDTYNLKLDLNKAAIESNKGPKNKEEMSLTELRNFLKNNTKKNERYYSALVELHEKFAIPFACFALGILAVPLGMLQISATRSFGLVLGLTFFLLYYLMLTIGWTLGESGVYPPVLGMWTPNIVMGSIGIYLLVRTANERPVRIDALLNWIEQVTLRFRRSKSCEID